MATIPIPDDHDDPLGVNITYNITGVWLLGGGEGGGRARRAAVLFYSFAHEPDRCRLYAQSRSLLCQRVGAVDALPFPAAGDPYGYFAIVNTYPATVVVAPGATILYYGVPRQYNLTIQSNDTRTPPMFGNYTLWVTVTHVNQPPVWVSRKCSDGYPGLCTSLCSGGLLSWGRVLERRAACG